GNCRGRASRWELVESNGAESPPAGLGKPGLRGGDGRARRRRRHGGGPAVEPMRRGPRVDAVVAAGVVAVVEDVGDRVPTLARRAERTLVGAVANDVAPRPQTQVHPAGDPDGKSAKAGGQGTAIAGLDDEVKMVGLHAEVEDAEARPARELAVGVLPDRPADDPGEGGSAQRADLIPNAPRDVDGLLARVP